MPIYQDALTVCVDLKKSQDNGVQGPSNPDTLRALSILAMIQDPGVAGKKGTKSKQALIIRSQKNSQTVAFTDAGAMAHCLPWFLGYLARQQNNPEAKELRELIVASANAEEKLWQQERDQRLAALQETQIAHDQKVLSPVGESAASADSKRHSVENSVLENKEEKLPTPAQQVTAAFSSRGVFAEAAEQIPNSEAKIQDIELKESKEGGFNSHIQTIVTEALIHGEENVIHDQHGLISQTQYSQIVCQEEERDPVTPFEAVVLCHAAGVFKDQSQRASFESLSEVTDLKGLADNTTTLRVEGREWELVSAPDKDDEGQRALRIEFLGSQAVNVVAAYQELVDLHKQNHSARVGGKYLVGFGIGSGLLLGAGAAAASFFLAASGPALPIVLGVLAFSAAAAGLLLRFYRRARYSHLEVKRNEIESAMNHLYGRSAGPAQAKMTRFHQGMLRDERQHRYAGAAEFKGDKEKLGEAIVRDPRLYIHRGRNYRAGSDQTQVAKAQASAVAAYIKSDRCDWGKLAGFLASNKFKSSQRFGCGWLGRATREGEIQTALQNKIEETVKNENLTSEQASSFLSAVFGENGAAFHLVDKDIVVGAVKKAFEAGGGAKLTEVGIKNSGWYQGAGDFFSEAGYGAQAKVLSAFNSRNNQPSRQP